MAPPPGGPRRLPVGAGHVHAELARQDDLIAATAQDFPEQPLTPALTAVDVGGVEERDSAVQRRVDHRAGPLEPYPTAEVVAAQAQDRDEQIAEFALAHADEASDRRADRAPGQPPP